MNQQDQHRERCLASVTDADGPGRRPMCTVTGIVVHGDERGRTIGFPTANLLLDPDGRLPVDGVYAGWYTQPDGRRYAAAVSVGRRATFYNYGTRLLEAFLLDAEVDLYGELAVVQLAGWVRGQRKFSGIDHLRRQLAGDVDAVRAVLADHQ